MSKKLLLELFNNDFSAIANNAQFHTLFFSRILNIHDLHKICDFVCVQTIVLGGVAIPAALLIKGKNKNPLPPNGGGTSAPHAILAQLHGNEPAGLAGILLAMALSEAGQLERDIIAVIGNPLAAQQYFTAYEQAPHARQETRDAYRCGLSDAGVLFPDMNRIPTDFLTREPGDHHSKRAQELHTIGQHIAGILDIHSARGNMLCVTDHKNWSELKNSPIRSVLTDLAEAISAHASASVKVQTLKTIFGTLFDLDSQTGIEAGRHESPEAPYNAASFTLSWLNALGLTAVGPLYTKENGLFNGYKVRPRITYSDLNYGNSLRAHDQIFMAKTCQSLASVPARSDHVIVKQAEAIYAIQSVADFTRKPAGSMEYAIYQYDEMEPIIKDQVVAVAIPSGTAFTAPADFSGIFLSKSATLYDKDPSVGPWPVHADHVGDVKFCYPCEVEELSIPALACPP